MESSSSTTESPVRRFFLKVKNWAFVTTPGSDPLVRSYLFLRKGIGIIGVALPFVLIIGAIILDHHLELSYSLSAYYYSVMGSVFVGSLWAIGIFLICYQYDHLDNIVSNIAGICVIGVSLFPTTRDGVTATQQQAIIHFVPYLSDNRWQHHYYPILIIEIVSTLAFGIAWFVKGETLDRLKAVIQRRPLSRHAESGHSAASSQSAVEQPDGLPAASSQPAEGT